MDEKHEGIEAMDTQESKKKKNFLHIFTAFQLENDECAYFLIYDSFRIISSEIYGQILIDNYGFSNFPIIVC